MVLEASNPSKTESVEGEQDFLGMDLQRGELLREPLSLKFGRAHAEVSQEVMTALRSLSYGSEHEMHLRSL